MTVVPATIYQPFNLGDETKYFCIDNDQVWGLSLIKKDYTEFLLFHCSENCYREKPNTFNVEDTNPDDDVSEHCSESDSFQCEEKLVLTYNYEKESIILIWYLGHIEYKRGESCNL